MYLQSVPSLHLSDLGTKIKRALEHESDHLDIERIRAVIDRAAIKLTGLMETNAGEVLNMVIIPNLLYGDDDQLVSSLSSELQRQRTLSGWSAEQWKSVFKKSVHA